MTAQLEKMIVPAYPLDTEQLGPDLRQALLYLSDRRLIDPRGIGIAFGRRQRIAIGLAIWR